MANITTYNQVITVLKDIAQRHYQINTFFLGKNWEIENTQDIVYPCLQVYPEVARMPQTNGEFKTLTVRLNCKVIDLVKQDQDNQKDVHSDTLQIAQDIVNELNQHPFYIRSNASLLGDIDLDNLEEYEDDFCAGWEFRLDIQLINNNVFCGLPIADIPGYSFPGAVSTGYSTSVQYLTCSTVTGCTTLQDYVSQVILTATTNGDFLPLSGGQMSGSIRMPQGAGYDLYNAAGTQIKAGLTQNSNTTFLLGLDASSTLVQSFDNITLFVGGGAGAKYATDYTPGFTNESLITKRYVDARILTASTTGNFLSISGGTVTGLTTFNSGLIANAITGSTINFSPYFSITDNNNLGLQLEEGNSFWYDTSTSPSINISTSNGGITLTETLTGGVIDVRAADVFLGNSNRNININGSDMQVEDSVLSRGLVYANNYTANFINESLITKRYVDARILTATTTGNYLPISGGTLTGTTLAPAFSATSISANTFYVSPVTGSTANSATTINTLLSDNYTYSLTSNTTFTFANFANGANKTIAVTQDTASSGNTVTWTAGSTTIKWQGGNTPVQTPTSGKTDIYTFIQLNNTIYGVVSPNF